MKSNPHLIASSWLSYDPLFIDTETTGLGNVAEMVEIAIVDSDGATVFHSLVRPFSLIPAAATRIHGITNQMVERAPTAPRIWLHLTTLLAGRHLVVYNAPFDERILRQTAYAWNLQPISLGPLHCCMTLFSEYYNDAHSWTSHSFQPMGRALELFDIKPKTKHRALADAESTRQILYSLLTTPRTHGQQLEQARTDT